MSASSFPDRAQSLADDLDAINAVLAADWPRLAGKRIFMTGGTGFIGRWMLSALGDANYFKTFVETELMASRAIALLCIALAWLYPRAISGTRLVFFLLMQSFVVQNPGGYGIAFIVFLVLLEQWRNFATATAITCAYGISVPGDYSIAKIIDVFRESWLSGRMVISEYVLPLGSIIRPGVIMIMLWVLAIDSLIDFHREAKRVPPMFGLRDRLALETGRPLQPALTS